MTQSEKFIAKEKGYVSVSESESRSGEEIMSYSLHLSVSRPDYNFIGTMFKNLHNNSVNRSTVQYIYLSVESTE